MILPEVKDDVQHTGCVMRYGKETRPAAYQAKICHPRSDSTTIHCHFFRAGANRLSIGYITSILFNFYTFKENSPINLIQSKPLAFQKSVKDRSLLRSYDLSQTKYRLKSMV